MPIGPPYQQYRPIRREGRRPLPEQFRPRYGGDRVDGAGDDGMTRPPASAAGVDPRFRTRRPSAEILMTPVAPEYTTGSHRFQHPLVLAPRPAVGTGIYQGRPDLLAHQAEEMRRAALDSARMMGRMMGRQPIGYADRGYAERPTQYVPARDFDRPHTPRGPGAYVHQPMGPTVGAAVMGYEPSGETLAEMAMARTCHGGACARKTDVSRGGAGRCPHCGRAMCADCTARALGHLRAGRDCECPTTGGVDVGGWR